MKKSDCNKCGNVLINSDFYNFKIKFKQFFTRERLTYIRLGVVMFIILMSTLIIYDINNNFLRIPYI